MAASVRLPTPCWSCDGPGHEHRAPGRVERRGRRRRDGAENPVEPVLKPPPCAVLAALSSALWTLAAGGAAGADNGIVGLPPDRLPRGYRYHHDEVREIPWSIHVFEFDRSRNDLGFASTLGNGNVLGLATVTEQVKALQGSPAVQPIAAVNGDFYNGDRAYPGDPRDLQVKDGELVSAPKGHACFWIDAAGQPRGTNVTSRFAVRWPGGTTTPFGLNEARNHDDAVLYSAANGPSTRTTDGEELLLEAVPGQPWIPLRPGEEIQARIRGIRSSGDTTLDRQHLVLSLGPALVPRLPKAAVGDVLRISTATFPDTRGVRMAIGGGPMLVHDSKPMEWGKSTARHPRTAVGWNRDRFFLVEVDGRQAGLSAGMSLPELADTLRKLGCEEAVNLDGGGSATLWVSGQVMNSPSEGRERPGANALVVVQHKAGPARKAP